MRLCLRGFFCCNDSGKSFDNLIFWKMLKKNFIDIMAQLAIAKNTVISPDFLVRKFYNFGLETMKLCLSTKLPYQEIK